MKSALVKNHIRPRKRIKNFWQGFKEFLRRYSIIGLAIAFVAGAAVNDLVQAVVRGLITPTIQLVVPDTRFQQLVFKIGEVEFDIGIVIDEAIHFIIILVLIYLLVRMVLREEGLLPPGKK